MSKSERVTLTGAHEHVSTLDDGREHSHRWAAGTHSLPAEAAASARAAGLVADEVEPAPRAPTKAAAKPAPPAKPVKPAPAKKRAAGPAKKPAKKA